MKFFYCASTYEQYTVKVIKNGRKREYSRVVTQLGLSGSEPATLSSVRNPTLTMSYHERGEKGKLKMGPMEKKDYRRRAFAAELLNS